jgi:TolB protein
MKNNFFHLIYFICLFSLLLFFGCKSNSGPETDQGTIKVITITEGENADGYNVQIGDEQRINIAANDTLISENLDNGTYKVELLELPEKCSMMGVNPVTVNIKDGQESTVTFNVNCSDSQIKTGTLEVVSNTSPANTDFSYSLILNETEEYEIAANDTLVFNNQEYGSYTLKLNVMPLNCSLEGENPEITQIKSEEKVTVVFNVQCDITGALEVFTTTSIINSEEIYSFNFGDEQFEIGANDTVKIAGIEPGDYQLELLDLPPSCTTKSNNPQDVSISTNSQKSRKFEIFCQTIFDYKFIVKSTLYEDDTHLYFLYPDGKTERITEDFGGISSPKLSPDKNKIAFTAVLPHVFEDELYLMNKDGTAIQKITEFPADPEIYNYTWTPDGESLLFSGKTGDETPSIFSIDIDSFSINRLTNNPDSSDFSPSMAPNGSKIVFHRRKGDSSDIYLMDPDGTNVTNITNLPDRLDVHPHWTPNSEMIYFSSFSDDIQTTLIYNLSTSSFNELKDSQGDAVIDPVWSPDGEKIAYIKPSNKEPNPETPGYNIYVMTANGSNSTKLTEAGELVDNTSPNWSPDGTKIAFTRSDWGWGIMQPHVMNPDGSEINNLGVEGCCFIWLPLN